MLVLGRNTGECINIIVGNERITIKLIYAINNFARLGIAASDNVHILRDNAHKTTK